MRGALQTHFADEENEIQGFGSAPFSRNERAKTGSQMCVLGNGASQALH